jgi:hypothetical protein
MLTNTNRSKMIQGWFAAATLVVVASLVLGASITVATAAVLLTLCLVPPAIVLILWRAPQPVRLSQGVYGPDRRT